MWCLPWGFAENDGRIGEAALGELEEETHRRCRVAGQLDVVTGRNDVCGNRVMLGFAVDEASGTPVPGGDAADVGFFPPDRLPPLAFPCRQRAIRRHRPR